MRRVELVAHLHAELDVDAFPDGQPNGVHVEGGPDIDRVVTGVSACQALFDEAVALDADAVITHHGILWGPTQTPITGPHRRRIKTLLDHDITLLSYHLPLDAHETLGNNALAARGLGLVDVEPFGWFDGVVLGRAGRFPDPVPREAFIERLAAFYGQDPLVFPHGPDPVSTVGIVSGAAPGTIGEAIDAGLDAYVTGEVREQTMHTAMEGGITFAACGHHATERLAMQALAGHLTKTFGLDARFVDIPNPV